MQSLKIIGEKIVKNSGEVLTVIAVDFSTRYIVKLDDGKIGYDLSVIIPKKIFRFENITLQEQVESKLKTPKDTIVNIKWDSNKDFFCIDLQDLAKNFGKLPPNTSIGFHQAL